MFQIMLDLETLGNTSDAPIISIGAVSFDIETREIGSRFYRVVDLESSVKSGGKIDPSTVKWWMTRSAGAREIFKQEGVPLLVALNSFSLWVNDHGNPDICVWGCGTDFDNVIMENTYRRVGMELPWNHFKNRCYRTIRELNPDVKMERIGVLHNAANDAESQARHLIRILNPM